MLLTSGFLLFAGKTTAYGLRQGSAFKRKLGGIVVDEITLYDETPQQETVEKPEMADPETVETTAQEQATQAQAWEPNSVPVETEPATENLPETETDILETEESFVSADGDMQRLLDSVDTLTAETQTINIHIQNMENLQVAGLCALGLIIGLILCTIVAKYLKH